MSRPPLRVPRWPVAAPEGPDFAAIRAEFDVPEEFPADVLADALRGRETHLGDARLAFGAPIARCVMTTRPQPGGIARDTSVLKTIHRERDGFLAVRAAVLDPGTVRVGDVLATAAD